MSEEVPREVCAGCARPRSVCFCEHVTQLATRTDILVLQHPKEEHMPIGTARMASLCLPRAKIAVGVELEGHPLVRALLGDAGARPVLVYPAPDARDLTTLSPDDVGTLVVLDGTWALAKKLYRKNPWLRGLPRVRFVPPRPSGYEIRREPRPDYVSTIEALAYALEALEGRDFSALLRPFSAMVELQKRMRDERRASRHVHARRGARPRVPDVFLAPERIVCLVGEANAFPRKIPFAPKDELVHVLAVRLVTGERFEELIRPSGPLAEATPFHTRLSEAELAAGGEASEVVARLGEFLRPGDVLASWGHYAPTLLRELGARIPDDRLDLRAVTAQAIGRRPGTLEAHAETLGPPPAPCGRGRGGVRLALVRDVARSLAVLRGSTPRA